MAPCPQCHVSLTYPNFDFVVDLRKRLNAVHWPLIGSPGAQHPRGPPLDVESCQIEVNSFKYLPTGQSKHDIVSQINVARSGFKMSLQRNIASVTIRVYRAFF
ncbi:unnamed protein product [Dibothriocephalus latus]|uniref:Uncharacterized protein n=1 Tax=Dibothriocephalus latus TaxID=60516 RepID=A0A3P7NKM3_DIBLA|nr:unnamed protein product [Dibothriocephalus latus]